MDCSVSPSEQKILMFTMTKQTNVVFHICGLNINSLGQLFSCQQLQAYYQTSLKLHLITVSLRYQTQVVVDSMLGITKTLLNKPHNSLVSLSVSAIAHT